MGKTLFIRDSRRVRGNQLLYAVDAGNHQVKVFDLEGTLVNTFGRRGGENGEKSERTVRRVAEQRKCFALAYELTFP